VAELADAGDLKSSGSDTLWVQFPPAPQPTPFTEDKLDGVFFFRKMDADYAVACGFFMDIRIVFMGSPDFALPSLRRLAAHYAVVGVVTQPDKPAGRGRTLTPPPVKQLALELGLPIMQPVKLREPQAMAQLQAWQPDVIVVAAFGQILRPAALDLPRFGCLNVHASLLPRWRGAAPIQAAILHGDAETGITIMRMDPGLDTGPMLSQRRLPITLEDTAGALSLKLADLGAELLLETLPGYLSGAIQPQPQTGAEPTYAPMLKKEEGLLDFSQPAQALARRVRAFNPWPGAYTTWEGQILKIHRAHAAITAVLTPNPSPLEIGEINPGLRVIYQGLPAIAAADGLLVVDELQPAGKKSIPGKVFLHGARHWPLSAAG
jgi:methionyl-tRNA formyltransferase